MKLRCRDVVLSLDRTLVMGVVNVTPDSFSDGGLWIEPARAIEHGVEMAQAGAAIIDVGGESTRPGADPVPDEEELRRVLPVVEGLVAAGAVVSIDTRKPDVAAQAVARGAALINDTSGEAFDPAMDEVAAATGAAMIVMHSRGTPATMKSLTHYDDVVFEVTSWLARRTDGLEAAGVARDSIVLDPGIGFAKTPGQSLSLLAGLDALVGLGYPVLVGTSRKSFIGAVLDLDVGERDEGTAASVAWAVAKGVQLVRVHDVVPMIRTVRMIEAIDSACR